MKLASLRSGRDGELMEGPLVYQGISHGFPG
jgi:hypothetical protein